MTSLMTGLDLVAPLLAAESGALPSPVDHIVVHPFKVSEGGWWWWSSATANLIISGLLMLLIGMYVAKRVQTGPESLGEARYLTKGKFAQLVEVLIVGLRDMMIKPVLGDRSDKFLPYLLCVFFFILVNNLLGLIPILDLLHLFNKDWKAQHIAPFGGTATANIAVTAVLATFSFLLINLAGIRELGIGGYLKHLTGGAPVFIWPILVPVEIMGTFIKPVALAIRLFANMTAGHVLMATLFMFVGMSLKAGLGVGVPVSLVSCIGATAIYFLELFVAFLQAFVFMFLTTVFISQLSHHGDHDHGHEHGHDGHHDHADHSHGGHAHPAH
jgi:F-type H+-transporting ATPase subunit a